MSEFNIIEKKLSQGRVKTSSIRKGIVELLIEKAKNNSKLEIISYGSSLAKQFRHFERAQIDPDKKKIMFGHDVHSYFTVTVYIDGSVGIDSHQPTVFYAQRDSKKMESLGNLLINWERYINEDLEILYDAIKSL